MPKYICKTCPAYVVVEERHLMVTSDPENELCVDCFDVVVNANEDPERLRTIADYIEARQEA